MTMDASSPPLERLPKSVKQFSDKRRGKNKELEQNVISSNHILLWGSF